MPRPGVGNPGCRGGGRKSAYQEKANAELVWELFFNDHTIEEIKEKMKTGRYSIKDVFMVKAFSGSERLLSELFRKVFPDKTDNNFKGQFDVNYRITRGRNNLVAPSP